MPTATGCYLEEGGALQDAGGAAHLSDGVHGELRPPDVHHGDAETSGQDGADGGAARAVVAHHHILQGGGAEQESIPLLCQQTFPVSGSFNEPSCFSSLYFTYKFLSPVSVLWQQHGALPGDLRQLLRNTHTRTHTPAEALPLCCRSL